MEVSILTKRKAVLNVCADPSGSVRRALCPQRAWGHHWPHSCLLTHLGRGSAVGSLLLLLPGPLEKALALRNTSASSSWDHEHGPCQWELIPMEPCGTLILEAVWPEMELLASLLSPDSEDSTYSSAFVQAVKWSILLALYLQLPKFPHLWCQNFLNLWTKVTNIT